MNYKQNFQDGWRHRAQSPFADKTLALAVKKNTPTDTLKFSSFVKYCLISLLCSKYFPGLLILNLLYFLKNF